MVMKKQEISVRLSECYSLQEASKKWAVSASHLRTLLNSGAYSEEEDKGLIRKMESMWIVTKPFMDEFFKARKEGTK